MRQTITSGTPALARQRGMLGQVQGLAMGRNQDLRPHPADHVVQLGAARMAGHMNQMIAIGDDLDALRHQAVDHPRHRLLVAGDGARGEDHAVARPRSATSGCSSSAMRGSAARGSPWLPVHKATTLSGGR